jgi:uncharacterized phage protein (TIGR02220 family)
MSAFLGLSTGALSGIAKRMAEKSLLEVDGNKRRTTELWWNHYEISVQNVNEKSTVVQNVNADRSECERDTILYKDKSKDNSPPAIAGTSPASDLTTPVKEKKRHMDGDERRAVAARVIAYLNDKALRKYPVDGRLSQTYIALIAARISDGVTEDQLMMVIDNRCANWLGDAKMSQYLQPSTIFTPKNFANYLESATRSGIGVPVESLLDEPLNDEARYNSWAGKMKRDYPKTNTEVRFFRASEFNAFFAERPEWCPVIWEKWSPDLLQKKFKTALRLLEESQSKAKLAPEGLFYYLKTWFKDEYDGKH